MKVNYSSFNNIFLNSSWETATHSYGTTVKGNLIQKDVVVVQQKTITDVSSS